MIPPVQSSSAEAYWRFSPFLFFGGDFFSILEMTILPLRGNFSDGLVEEVQIFVMIMQQQHLLS